MPKRDQEYWGLSSIAKRFKCSWPTVKKLYHSYGLFMFKIPRPGSNPKMVRLSWYTNENLIELWQLERVLKQRQMDQHKRMEKRKNGYYRVKEQPGEPKAG